MNARLSFCALVLVALGLSRSALAAGDPDTSNIRDFGAKGDGHTLDTRAVQSAIDACFAHGGGRVLVPAGTFLIAPIHLSSHVELHLSTGATLLGSPKLADYLDGQTPPPAVKLKSPESRGKHPDHPLALISAKDAEDISITGTGTINGNGGSADFDRGDNDPFRPKILLFDDCTDARVSDVTLRDSATWVQHYIGCRRVRISGIRVYSHANLNNDGLDIDSADVNVSDCIIDSDDDGICLKSDRTSICQNVTISNCVVGSNCNAIKMGTASRGGFRDINIQNCVIRLASEHRQRAWKNTISGLSLEMVDGGIMDRVAVSNLTMSGVQTPIFIRLGARHRAPDQPASSLSNIVMSNITARSDSPICNSITGIPGEYTCRIKLSHLNFECPGGGTAEMATRPIPENIRGYPENRMFGTSLPAYGLYVRHVRDLTLDDISFTLLHPDARPAVVLDDVQQVRLSGLTVDMPTGGAPAIQAKQAKSLFLDNCRIRGEEKPLTAEIHPAVEADWYTRALLVAPSVAAYAHDIKTKVAWIVDEESPDEVKLAVGEDMPDHFTRGLTVKVLRNGAVFVLENRDGDERWRLDLPPISRHD